MSTYNEQRAPVMIFSHLMPVKSVLALLTISNQKVLNMSELLHIFDASTWSLFVASFILYCSLKMAHFRVEKWLAKQYKQLQPFETKFYLKSHERWPAPRLQSIGAKHPELFDKENFHYSRIVLDFYNICLGMGKGRGFVVTLKD